MQNCTPMDRAALERLSTAADADQLPITYFRDGVPKRGIGAEFSPKMVENITKDAQHRTVWEGTDDTGLTLRVECTTYLDFPVTEWIAFFIHKGSTPSSLISDVRVGVCEIAGQDFVLQHGNGETRRTDGFSWETDKLDASVCLEPTGGTSCQEAFPYMRVLTEEYCLNLAIGWPGHWCASFVPSDGRLSMAFGQKRFAMRLLPGETIRTPRITMMISTGGEDRSRNLWRRWFIAHILVRENGQPLSPKLCMHLYGENGKPEFTGATEEGQLAAMAEYHRRGIHPDIWWMDAGWYPCDYEWLKIGTWKPDPARFPHGLKPIGEACRQYGMQFLLWFEPERVRENTELYKEHPEWLIRTGKLDGHRDNCLLNLGDPACCDWVIERIDSIISESDVQIYRQDFNYFSAPENLWIQIEESDRAGSAENLHVQGYLRLWDTLRARHPGLWVDSCASGGRRNDLESMRRGVPLHYTDVGYGDHPLKQKQHRLMFEWIPYFRAHNMSWDREDGTYGTSDTGWHDPFSFQAAMAPSLTSMVSAYADEREVEAARLMHPIWRRAAELMLRGDYYPLTKCRASAEDYYAMQFCDSVRDDGFVQVLRNTRAEADSYTVTLCDLDPTGQYRFTEAVTGESFVLAGDAPTFSVQIPARSAVLYFYERMA